MIYLLVDHFLKWLEAHGLGFLRVFTFPTFQLVAAILLSFLLCVMVGPRLIEWLRHQKIGDRSEFDQADLNKIMEGKKGTPTMGGILIICAIAITTLLLGNLRNFYVEMAVVCLVWL